jgi:hypothetical protein
MRTALLVVCCVLFCGLDAQTPQPNDSQKIILTSLNNGDTLMVGDTVTVQWECIDNIISVDIRFSPDRGKTWILLNGSSIGYMDTKSWGHYKWVVPEKIKENPPNTNEFDLVGNSNCLIRVENYSPKDPTEISASAKPLTIIARNGVIIPGRHTAQAPAFNLSAMLSRSASAIEGNASIRFFDARGRVITSSKGMASGLIVGVYHEKAWQIRGARKAAYVRQR